MIFSRASLAVSGESNSATVAPTAAPAAKTKVVLIKSFISYWWVYWFAGAKLLFFFEIRKKKYSLLRFFLAYVQKKY
jgi:hypothetical protein